MGILIRIIAIVTGASIAWASGSDIIGNDDMQTAVIHAAANITHSDIIEDITFDEKTGKQYIDITLESLEAWTELSRGDSRKFASDMFKIGEEHYGRETHIRIVYDGVMHAQLWWKNGLNYSTDSP